MKSYLPIKKNVKYLIFYILSFLNVSLNMFIFLFELFYAG